LLRYGLPTGLQMTAEISAFSVFLFLVGHLGKEQLAATNLAFNVNMLSFVPMLGVGTAVMTIVGRRIGEGRPELAIRTTWLAAASTAVYMFAFAGVFVALPEIILRPFLGSGASGELADIRQDVVILLRFVAFYTFFDGVVIVFSSAIRGAGDTRFPFVYTLILAWSVMVLPTALMIVTGHGGLFFAWTACSSYISLLGIGFFVRFLRGRWKSMNVIGAPKAQPDLRATAFDPPIDRHSTLVDVSSLPR
jgi:MATE family multidrug resistance protein